MNRALFSTGKDDWETPKDFYKRLDNEFHLHLTHVAHTKTQNAKSITQKTIMG